MMTLSINGKEYKVKFGYNCFCDTDLIDRVRMVAGLFAGTDKDMTNEEAQNAGAQKMKDLFCVVRELLFVGFKKYNPVETEQEVGDLIDDYVEEETDEKRGLFTLFTQLSEELMSRGFLNEIIGNPEEAEMENGAKKPTDHKTETK